MKSIKELLNMDNQEPLQTPDAAESQEVITVDESFNQEFKKEQTVSEYSIDNVIDLLKQSLAIHWQQTTSLSAQAVHLERWGYKKFASVIRDDAEEEHKHAIINIERLEFFDIDYQPLVVNPGSWARHDMVTMIQYNLNSAKEAAATEKRTIIAARSIGDELTANSMIPLLQGSENAIRLYESYLKLIEQMGVDNFLTLQV